MPSRDMTKTKHKTKYIPQVSYFIKVENLCKINIYVIHLIENFHLFN